ncbi:MAG TPA: DUF1223 domain-containing protein [Candidatus Acidoferrum sp.]|nr:DUF1223 domain-containing protein [Candidatus Acidoferrum sp.]
MLFRFPILILAAISVLAVFSLGHLRAVSTQTVSVNDDGSRVPVLIELFTSEGCSSCPPADSLLERLDRSQPARGAELIVLSEHVDYWDDIGWKDPYSSHEYSERQSAYAGRFGLGSIYTPQMVVDGHIEFVSSDERRAAQAIANATKVEKTLVTISSIRLSDEKTISLHLETGPLASSIEGNSAEVWIATADDSDESHVSRGENAGRTLRHVAVLRNLVRVGTVTSTDKFSRDVSVRLNNPDSRNIKLVAIVQELMAGRVWGVESTRFSR